MRTIEQRAGYRTFAEYHDECNAYCHDGRHAFVGFGHPEWFDDVTEWARAVYQEFWDDIEVEHARLAPECPVDEVSYCLNKGEDHRTSGLAGILVFARLKDRNAGDRT